MATLALTVLLALLWLAFVGFGYWHGGWRQVILLAATLLSYAVLSEWAAPNGRDLSTRFQWSVARTTTGVALVYLLVGTFVLGFLGSFALYRPRPLGQWERTLGAAMGILDGGLLLALVLRTLRSYAFAAGRGQALHDSALSRFLIEDVAYLLLIALLLGGVAAVVGVVMARRDETREMALLASVTPPAVVTPIEPLHDEQPAASARPAQSLPTSQPAPPPAREPVYPTAPLIDWPTGAPPGTQLAPPFVDAPSKPAGRNSAAQTDASPGPSPLPTRPQLPPRVPPPMVYPIADLIAAHAKLIPPSPETPTVATAASVPPPNAPGTLTPAASIPMRPVGPPPGATHPAFVPPAALRPSTPPVREAPSSPPPPSLELPSPVVRELDPAAEETPPPVVRELDVPPHALSATRSDAVSASNIIPEEARQDMDGGTMDARNVSPAPPAPNTTTTAAIPAVVPPPLPPPAPRSATVAKPPSNDHPPALPNRAIQDDEAKARTGFARVAVARQAGSRPDEPVPPHPPSPAPPEPLHPPLPTGPRVHPCTTCGYPVRDHARYCPNCGSRQGRP